MTDTSPTLVFVDTFKGGTGKTTTALWLARSLAATGDRVLLSGLSPQNDLDVGVQANTSSAGIREALTSNDLHAIPPARAVTENLWYLPAGTAPLPERDSGVGALLHRVASAQDCTWCVVDGINFLHDSAWWVLDAAEVLIVPSLLEAQPVNAALRTLRAVAQYQSELRRLQALRVARMLLVAVPPPSQRSAASVELLEALRLEYGDVVFDAEVRRTARRVVSEGEMLVGNQLRTVLSGNRIEEDYRAVANELRRLVAAEVGA